jgi:hypothetical protein
LDRQLAAMKKQQDKHWADYYAAKDELQAIAQNTGLEKQQAITEVLSEIRPLGYSAQRSPASLPPTAAVQTHLEEVGKKLPREWFERSHSYGELIVRDTRDFDPYQWRSFYRHNTGEAPSQLAVAMKQQVEQWDLTTPGRRTITTVIEDRRPLDIQSSTIHEFGHRVEDTSPQISRAMDDFWKQRTGDDPWEKMSDVAGPGYNDYEMTKKDKFTHPYMGKRYGTHGSELLSMGLEGVYYNRWNLWETDEEYVQFIMGVLSVL